MLLFHASQKKFSIINRNQASIAEGVDVPAGELQDMIYLTPSLGFALAMAAGPDGITHVANGEISFERAGEFDPEATIYLYTVESDELDQTKLAQIDADQYTLDQDEVVPKAIVVYKAKDVFQYHQLADFKTIQLNPSVPLGQ